MSADNVAVPSSSSLCTLHVRVRGAIGAAIAAYCHAHNNAAAAAATAPQASEVTYCRSTTTPLQQQNVVHLGLVAAAPQLGAWMSSSSSNDDDDACTPLLLRRSNDNNAASAVGGDDVYTACVTLPASTLSPSSHTLECRLVLLQEHATHTHNGDDNDVTRAGASAVKAQRRICAVDTAHTQPRLATLRRLTSSSSSSCATRHDDNNNNNNGGGSSDACVGCDEWLAELHIGDVGDTAASPSAQPDVHFTAAHEQFAWLCAQQQQQQQQQLRSDVRSSNNNTHKNNTTRQRTSSSSSSSSCMLSLTFYLADPTVSFSRDVSLRQLPAVVRRGLQYVEEHQQQQQQQQQTQQQHDHACSSCDIHDAFGVVHVAPRHSHNNSSRHCRRDDVTALSSSPSCCWWCVQPLRHARPVSGDGFCATRTQHCWHTTVHTGIFGSGSGNNNNNDDDDDDDALEVTVRVPVVCDAARAHHDDNNECGKVAPTASATPSAAVVHIATGTTALTRSMLPCVERGDVRGANAPPTRGTLRLPVYCSTAATPVAAMSPQATSATTAAPLTVCVVLHVQYLLLRPYVHPRHSLRVVRSRESDARMCVAHVAGHRGLGRTYTRAPHRNALCKLAENTVAAFCAAHRRGCAMVELDVMHTRDRVPVVMHDPLVQVMASDKDITCAAAHAGASCGGCATMPVVAAVHELTHRQLCSLALRSYYFGTRPSVLQHLLLRHWPALVQGRQQRRCCQHHHNNNNDCNSSSSGHDDDDTGVAAQRRRPCALPRRHVDIVAPLPTLRDVLTHTPATLQLNVEVKYPFQPQWDANLFLQSQAFEVNAFVDDILDVVFANAQPQRGIVFGSFDPDVCIALACKQSRYDVVYICDADELSDLKDYRCFHTEGAVQFAQLHRLGGVSLRATSLCRPDQRDYPDAHPYTAFRNTTTATAVTAAAAATAATKTMTTTAQADGNDDNDGDGDVQHWRDFDVAYGRAMVRGAHARGLRVWTWGDCNSDARFVQAQQRDMLVDAVIADHIPHADITSAQ